MEAPPIGSYKLRALRGDDCIAEHDISIDSGTDQIAVEARGSVAVTCTGSFSAATTHLYLVDSALFDAMRPRDWADVTAETMESMRAAAAAGAEARTWRRIDLLPTTTTVAGLDRHRPLRAIVCADPEHRVVISPEHEDSRAQVTPMEEGKLVALHSSVGSVAPATSRLVLPWDRACEIQVRVSRREVLRLLAGSFASADRAIVIVHRHTPPDKAGLHLWTTVETWIHDEPPPTSWDWVVPDAGTYKFCVLADLQGTWCMSLLAWNNADPVRELALDAGIGPRTLVIEADPGAGAPAELEWQLHLAGEWPQTAGFRGRLRAGTMHSYGRTWPITFPLAVRGLGRAGPKSRQEWEAWRGDVRLRADIDAATGRGIARRAR